MEELTKDKQILLYLNVCDSVCMGLVHDIHFCCIMYLVASYILVQESNFRLLAETALAIVQFQGSVVSNLASVLLHGLLAYSEK